MKYEKKDQNTLLKNADPGSIRGDPEKCHRTAVSK